jgi:hypothetical protein
MLVPPRSIPATSSIDLLLELVGNILPCGAIITA